MRGLLIMTALLVLQSTGAAAPASRSAAAERRDERNRSHVEAAEPAEPIELDEPDETGEGRRLIPAPSIRAVLAAAYAAAGLDRDPGRGWIRRARLAGLIPWLTMRTTRDTSWQDANSEVGHGNSLEIRATWRLDRLVFDAREIQVAAIESARRRERQRLATRVIHAYFTWRRAAGVATEPEDERVAARVTARVAEATAELDALTDGWFSDELMRLGRGASRVRPPPAAAP